MTTIYLATGQGVSVIRGSKESWEGATQLQDKQVECLVVDPEDSDTAFCGTLGAGLFATSDAGLSWRPCSGFPQASVTALAADGTGVLFAGTEPSQVWRSDDRGATWFPLPSLMELPQAQQWSFPPRPHTHHVRAILPDPERPSDLHVAVEAGALLRSEGGGSGWMDRVPSGPRDTHWLISDPQQRSKLFSAAGDGFFESSDDGKTWKRFEDGLEGTYCWSVAMSLGSSRALVMSAAQSAYAAHYEPYADSYVYRKEGAAPWQRVLLPDSRRHRAAVIASVQASPGSLLMSTEGAVFRSTDEGRSWRELPIHWMNGRAKHAVDIAIG